MPTKKQINDRADNDTTPSADISQEQWSAMDHDARVEYLTDGTIDGVDVEERSPEAKAASALSDATKASVAAAVTAIRAQTSRIHELQDAHDKGKAVTRLHLDELKARIDVAVNDLCAAVGIQ
jgi:hypothetical protein